MADRVKRLRTQEATRKSQIDKLELDLQRHREMLQGVLSRIREVRSVMSFGPRLQKNKLEAIPPTQSDSQQGDDMVGQTASEEMYLSTVEEEIGDESMLMGTSTGAEDVLDVCRDNGIWERRRNAITKNKRRQG